MIENHTLSPAIKDKLWKRNCTTLYVYWTLLNCCMHNCTSCISLEADWVKNDKRKCKQNIQFL